MHSEVHLFDGTYEGIGKKKQEKSLLPIKIYGGYQLMRKDV